VPGLAKTLAVTTLAEMIQASFQRIQFTPDLLPADLIGTLIYSPKSGEFTTRKGPIFADRRRLGGSRRGWRGRGCNGIMRQRRVGEVGQ
jgi:MoxR-like ATPase